MRDLATLGIEEKHEIPETIGTGDRNAVLFGKAGDLGGVEQIFVRLVVEKVKCRP